jgi:hypothetical protein
MCSAWISEQSAIISLYGINLWVFITEGESVYSAVRTVSSNQIQFRPERVKQLTQAIASFNLLKGSEDIFSLMNMSGKITVFRGVTLCSFVAMYQCLGGACYPKFRTQEWIVTFNRGLKKIWFSRWIKHLNSAAKSKILEKNIEEYYGMWKSSFVQRNIC